MSKRITQQDIMDMAVHKIEQDLAADINKDGKITPEDARLAPDGIEIEEPQDRPDALPTISQAILDRLLNTPEYRYDSDSDPLYRQYRELYEAQGRRAAENAYGLAGAYTGGYGSSYAATAANDAYALYMDKLAATGAKLEQRAYERANAEKADLYRLYSTARDWEDAVYSRERDGKNDAYRDNQLAWEKTKDLVSFAFQAAQQGDYAFLSALGVDTSRLEEMDEKERAAFLAKYGDYSGLASLGADISRLEEADAEEKAKLFAKYGDYSGLAALGMDISGIAAQNAERQAELFAKYGDYSGLAALGADLSSQEEQSAMDQAAFYAKFGDYSGLEKLGIDVSRLKKEQLIEIATLFARFGDFSLLRMLL